MTRGVLKLQLKPPALGPAKTVGLYKEAEKAGPFTDGSFLRLTYMP